MSFILKRHPQIFKNSLTGITRRLIPTSISPLKPRRHAALLCNEVKASLLDDTKKFHLRTRRAIHVAIQGKHGPDRIFAKDLNASRHGWEKLLRRRDRASSTARGHRTRLALSPISQPHCASPPGSSHRSPPVHRRAQVVVRRQAQLRQAKMRARMQRRKEVYRNVRNAFAGHNAPESTKDIDPAPLEVPMEDIQPAPLVYTARPRSPTTPTMSWFCRNLSQARAVQPRPPVPPLPSVEPVPPFEPMPPSRRAAPVQPVRPVKQAKAVLWGCRAGSPRGCTATPPTTPRGPRRMWKPVIRDRILPLTPLPLTPIKSRRIGRALFDGSQ
ncbi:hypothetical protein LXA43DRAFT_95253 [Ganoderma leucocontextum]|nr:hypothetical protein LXA43DRAFT_95253 [Ganoderma leucocontextum]